MLVGHGTVRFNVMGMASRAPDDAELSEMGDLVAEALEEGALGLSTGLVYTPCVYAETEEVRALAAPGTGTRRSPGPPSRARASSRRARSSRGRCATRRTSPPTGSVRTKAGS